MTARLLKAAAHCLLFATVVVAAPAASTLQYPAHLPVPGGIAVIEIGGAYGADFEARFGRKPILVVERQGVWFAVVGIGLDTPLGNYLISVKSPDSVTSVGFYVKPHSYLFKDQFSELGIPDNPVTSATWRSRLDASFPLISPVRGNLVEQFGSRYQTGQVAKTVEWAVLSDIDGDDVVAPGRGRIADILNIDGINYFVTIDHGMGLLSSIGPVRKIDQESGQQVEKGETLGKLGIDTIRPHTLYWKVSLNGVAVNPDLVSDQLQVPARE